MQIRRSRFSDEQKAAMRLVETMIEDGVVVLGPDRWVEGSLRFQPPPVISVEAIQGQAMSFALDPLEQAIELTTRVLRDEREHLAHISMTLSGDVPPSPIYKRMSSHLEALLDAQLKRVADHE